MGAAVRGTKFITRLLPAGGPAAGTGAGDKGIETHAPAPLDRAFAQSQLRVPKKAGPVPAASGTGPGPGIPAAAGSEAEFAASAAAAVAQDWALV